MGFEGEYCERLVDFCVYLNCNKNNTRETIRHYGTCYCHCKEGYFGDTCDEEVNACEKRDIKLCGQGECKAVGVGYAPVNEYSGYKCVCKAGNLRASDNCLSFNSSCPLSNCYLPHGVCKDKSYNDTACICREGYYGKDCLEDVNYCSDETCLHNGTCHQGRDTRRLPRMMCDCPPETDGVNCEEMPSPCDKDPCGEHGECIPRGKYNFTCRCKDGYRAPQCITPPSQCVDGHSYCNEHGICKSYDRFDSCECFRGYTGRQCEQESTNQFNLFFTGRSVLKPPVHSMDVDCKTKDYITLTAWMKYDKSVYGFDTFPITLKNHHDDFVRIDRTKVIVNNVTIDISESKVGLEQWVYYVITYDVHNRIVSVVVNNGPAYKRDINVYCMTLKLLLGTQVNEKPMVPIFKGEMGLVQVHNVAFSFLEINEQIKNCLKWHFKEENVIISWRDINLTTWSRTDVQVLVPGVCSKTNCRNGAKECSPEIDRIPPKPINCPSLIRRNSTSRLYREDWGEIKFEDDSYIVEVKSNYFCNQTLTFGYYHVVYIAVDMHNNYGRCEFDVVIANEGESEPTLDASYTKSWYREFETDQVKSYQQLECIKNEHQFIDDNSPFYTMDFMNHWSVRGSYYPTCSKAEFPMQNLTGNLTNFNYDCDNQDELDYVTLERILWAINNASEEFEKTYDKGFCEKNDCTDNTIIIPPVCDNTTNFNKNRNRWSRAVTLDLFGTYEYILSTNNTQHVVRDFVIEALRKQFEVKKIRVYANNESWELPTPYQNFECADEAQYVRLTTELDNDQEQFFCFLPGPGKFFNKTLNKVEECHIGYYKETHGSELCSECGENRTTLIRGARNETDCFYINCNKGQYGDSEGCHPCKRGEYNNVGGRDKCNHCVPGWYTTLQEGSTKEDDCIWPCERWENYDLITGCAPCVNGTFMDFSVSPGCKPCNKGFTSEFNSTSKEDCKYVFCPLGFTIKNERNNSLTDDQTLSETTFINFCTPCAVGKYKHWHGNQNCASCPANSTTVAEGSKYKNDCSVIRCPDGNGKVCSAGYTCHNYMCTKVPNFQPEENWFGYVLASLSLGMLFILCIFCVIYRGFVVMYIDSSCPWILFCWKPKQGQRRFSVNPARDTSNLPMSPSSDDGPTNILETDIDDDRRPRFDTGSTDASCVRQRKLGAQSSNILDELRSNLMHVMASPTSAISSDSSGKRTPPPILTGSPSRRDLEAAKAAARVARSETYQMATFDNNPRIQFQSNFIRHHRTYGPLAVDARTNHTIPRVTIVSTETTSETNEDDDEGFFK
ncbi:unnamed protein product [Bursaphelenchus okinawaensis]|uniref:EGF-like domain-containing protein n=1 Tax=Bursaphelenchus okinawaensis TaxID=465554 RepID=A0A811L1D0_9BILA|nr:unnamed protein product [Bursaphelenchus okinawaensis]CAG9115752.1 unnamed protein product [Bursaphelenchus okinawaensis]